LSPDDTLSHICDAWTAELDGVCSKGGQARCVQLPHCAIEPILPRAATRAFHEEDEASSVESSWVRVRRCRLLEEVLKWYCAGGLWQAGKACQSIQELGACVGISRGGPSGVAETCDAMMNAQNPEPMTEWAAGLQESMMEGGVCTAVAGGWTELGRSCMTFTGGRSVDKKKKMVTGGTGLRHPDR